MRGRRGHPLASSKAEDAPLCFIPSRAVGHGCAVVRKLMAALRQELAALSLPGSGSFQYLAQRATQAPKGAGPRWGFLR